MNREREKYIKASSSPICVDWRVSEHEEPFSCHKPVTSGRAYTTSDIDFTVKVEADGLEPFKTYWYQFVICDTDIKSVVGRTKTAPGPDDDVSAISLAVFSCANWPMGYFNAYGNAARKDNVDYFIHLGDYIYEDEHGVPGEDERAMIPGRETITLHDYRTRHGQYRTDEDLLLAHQMFPWIPVWDDHDLINNGWRDGGSSINNTEASFIQQGGVSFDQRKMNAVRAYFEWVPLRQADLDDNLRIWRNFRLGNLMDLTMLDTRHYDRSITRVGPNEAYVHMIADDAGGVEHARLEAGELVLPPAEREPGAAAMLARHRESDDLLTHEHDRLDQQDQRLRRRRLGRVSVHAQPDVRANLRRGHRQRRHARRRQPPELGQRPRLAR